VGGDERSAKDEGKGEGAEVHYNLRGSNPVEANRLMDLALLLTTATGLRARPGSFGLCAERSR
jgi:hypothetical protein